MRWKYFFLMILILSCTTSKKSLLRHVEKSSLKMNAPDSILLSIQKRNDLVIGYGTNSTWNHGMFYCLFVLKGIKWQAIKYIKEAYSVNGGKSYSIDSFSIPGQYVDSLLWSISKNRSWEIMKEINGDERNCPHLLTKYGDPCSSLDAEHYCFELMTKNYFNSFVLYDPYFFENECCPGWKPRQKFLETVKPIRDFFKDLK